MLLRAYVTIVSMLVLCTGAIGVAQQAPRLTVVESGRIGNPRVEFLRFVALGDVHRTPDGWTYLIDWNSAELRAFDSKGLPAWVVGRRDYDEAPRFGRWWAPSFTVSGDTIAVLDRNAAVHFVDRRTGKEMKVHGQSVLKFRRAVGDPLRLASTDKGWVLVSERRLPEPEGEKSGAYSRLTARRLSLESGLTADTIWSANSGLYSIWVFGRRMTTSVPFGAQPALAIGRQGLVVSDSGWQLWMRNGKGTPPARIAIDFPVIPVTQDSITGYFARLEKRQIDTLAFPDQRALPIPARRQTIGGIRIAPDGSLAIVRPDMVSTPPEPIDSVYIDIIRPTGQRGIAALPPGFELRQFTGTELVGVLNTAEVCSGPRDTPQRVCRDVVTYTLK